MKLLKEVREILLGSPRQLTRVKQELARERARRQRVEEALQETEAKYRSIFENAIEGMFQTTPAGYYMIANPALARIYGYSSPEELKTHLRDINHQLYVDPNRRAEFMKSLEQDGYVSGFESQVYRADGSIIWISESARAVCGATGELLYYEGTAEDVTDRKQAEVVLRRSEAKFREQAAQLEEALHQLQRTQDSLAKTEKMSSLGELVAGVAHEIKNPVSFVCGNITHAIDYVQDLLYLISLYQQHYPRPVEPIAQASEEMDLEFAMSDLPKTLESMQVGADRIHQIVLSLRNFSHNDETLKRPVDIHQGIDSTLLILQNRLKRTSGHQEIEICKEYGDLPLVECYGGQMNQVFMNILSNAIDALEEAQDRKDVQCPSPKINIRTRVVDGHRVLISIADNGPGIPPAVSQRLFDSFFTTKPVGKGTGMGLSISHQIIVEKHGGKLNCISTPGQGAEFAISIPIKAESKEKE
ncbi:MAG: ATP-binding protein [Hormoscilla sp.]